MSKKNVLITGGARGIGAAVANKFQSKNYRVFINYVNSTKVAVDSFNKYLAQELGAYGITSNVVAPGLVLTDATAQAPDEFKEFIKSVTPTGNISQPEDVANAVYLLAQDESSQLTGTYLPVCGGAYLG